MHKSGVKDPSSNIAKIAQMGRHEIINRSEHYRQPLGPGSIPVRGNFSAEFILL